MKMRLIKINPEFLIEFLQGKTSTFNFNLPKDIELLDLKYDLFSRQVTAIIRSDSFEDLTESFPIPEFTPSTSTVTKPAAAASTIVKPEVKPVVKQAPVQKTKGTCSVEDEFSADQRRLLSFTVKDEYVIVKPTQFLKAEWNDINDVVKSIGGKWVKGDIISYWEIPLTQT
jgi:hypothetical protein